MMKEELINALFPLIRYSNDVPIDGKYKAITISKENTGTRYADILKQIFNKDLNVVEKNYDRAIQQEQPGGFTRHGREEVTNFWNTLDICLS